MAASVEEVILLDGETNCQFKVVISIEDAKRAREDMEFATTLLHHAKSVHAANSKTSNRHCRDQHQRLQPPLPIHQTQQQPEQQPQPQEQHQQPQLQQQNDENCDESVHNWSNTEVLLLLELYKTNEAMFTSGKMTQKNCWANIAKKMQEKGHFVSGTKCTIKFQALKRTYKNVLAHNSKSGNDRKEWEYFAQMDDMFRNRPWVKPLSIAGSNIPAVEDPVPASTSQSATRKAKVDAALLQYMKDTAEDRPLRREMQEARHREKMNVLNELKDIFKNM